MVEAWAAAGMKLIDGIKHQGQMTHAGVAIATAAILDVQLEKCLKKAMRPMSSKMYRRLFDSFRPLNSFSSKIAVAYALNITSKEIYDELEKIREIRNAFAHSADLLHFESEPIASVFCTLKRPPGSRATKPSLIFLECAKAIDSALEEYLAGSSR